jgi:hypothetical protein
MAYLNNFDANSVDPASSFDPIPTGKYVAVITESEMKPTKSGTGHYLELTFDILDGQYKGRKVWARLNLDNPNAQAVQIARGELSAICRAVGVMQPQDSIELHNLPLSIKVACKKRDDTGEITNEIKGYEKKEAALSTAPAANPTAPAAQATSNTPPWQR